MRNAHISKQDSDLDITWFCFSTMRPQEEGVLGITGRRSLKGLSDVETNWNRSVFWHLLSVQTSQLLWLFFPWKIQKGESVRVPHRSQGHQHDAYMHESGGSFISFLWRSSDVQARHGSSACISQSAETDWLQSHCHYASGQTLD